MLFIDSINAYNGTVVHVYYCQPKPVAFKSLSKCGKIKWKSTVLFLPNIGYIVVEISENQALGSCLACRVHFPFVN